jgi:hypothetical protein
MHLNPDVHHQYALDRQQRLRDEADAHRLADRMPTRTRIARFLRLGAHPAQLAQRWTTPMLPNHTTRSAR